PPLVEVAEQDGWPQHRLGRFDKRARLLRTGTAQQPEMRSDHAQRNALQLEIDDDRAARLKAGQPDLPHVLDDATPGEDEIAVPAVAAAVFRRVRGNEIGIALQRIEVEQPLPRAGS